MSRLWGSLTSFPPTTRDSRRLLLGAKPGDGFVHEAGERCGQFFALLLAPLVIGLKPAHLSAKLIGVALERLSQISNSLQLLRRPPEPLGNWYRTPIWG